MASVPRGGVTSLTAASLLRSDDFSDMYAHAREERADLLFEELFEIADKPCINQVEVQQQRNRLDTRKWALSKLAPRKYGDRVEHDVKSNVSLPAILI